MAVLPADKKLPKRGRPAKMREILLGGKSLAVIKLTNKQVTCHNPTKPESHKRKRVTTASLYDNEGVKSAVLKRAEEVQANLVPEFPSMIKCMLPSHVSGGFWLGLNKQFCNEHMPKQDTMIVLEDESGINYQTKFLVEKVGLSGGWRGFSIAHKLLEGDVLVFQLVKPTKFKVYIVKTNGLEEVDGALGLLKLDACKKQMSHENLSTATEEIEYGSEDFGFDVLDGMRLSESAVDFNQVKSFEDFDILINGLVINPELSKHLQSKYYDLCCSQRSFLHEQLLGGLNCKLAAGVIAETINIADAIRASQLTTPPESFVTWQKTLKAFQTLGMNIHFLLDRLDQLKSLAAKSKRHKEARLERVNAEEEMRTLEKRLLEIKEITSRLDIEIQQLEGNAENYELKFQELAKAPWYPKA